MTRLFTAGAEVDIGGSGVVSTPDNSQHTATQVTRDTTTVRSGAASWKCDSGAGNLAAFILFDITSVASAGVRYFFRMYMLLSNLPSADTAIAYMGGASDMQVLLTSAGQLQLFRSITQIGSNSAALSTGVWYRLELMSLLDGTATNFTEAELRLDGNTLAAATGFTEARADTRIAGGWITNPGANKIMYIDDVALNTDTGGVNDTWPGEGRVLWMTPGADSQRGSWTGGAGGTTNLFAAVDNTPPVGTATETDTTQIESVDTSGDNATDEYRGDCGTYTAKGVGLLDTVVIVQPWCNHGEDVATNTKTGSFGPQSNPGNTYDTFTFGNDAGALGTYPTLWTWTKGTKVEMPTITKGSSFIIAARKTDTGTRVASIDALGAYIEVKTGFGAGPSPRIYPDAHVMESWREA